MAKEKVLYNLHQRGECKCSFSNYNFFSMLVLKAVMEQHTLEIVKNYLNTNIYSYLETCGGRSSNLYLNVVHISNTSVY
jgi:hypothetical protein